MNDITVSCLRFSLQDEDYNGEDHAEDGDGEPHIGYILQLGGMNSNITNKLLMNIENKSKVC